MPSERIWKTWPLENVIFSYGLWHMKDICWTADRLARHGLPNPENCSWYNQAQETVNHLLMLGCSNLLLSQMKFILTTGGRRYDAQLLVSDVETVHGRDAQFPSISTSEKIGSTPWLCWELGLSGLTANACVFDGATLSMAAEESGVFGN
ncbi:hypothetical protein EJB05_00845, partial [Eragrostis curvula]